MFPSFLLALREGLEAALIIGIVIGALSKIQRSELNLVVWWGVAAAVVISLTFGVLLNYLGAGFAGRTEEIFEGIAMLLAAGILTWMIFWMRNHSRSLKTDLEADVRQATLRNGSKALFALAFLAVAREGFELVLFLVAARLATDTIQTITGAALGLGVAIFMGWTLFTTTRRLNLKQFFKVTNVLLILFAAGLVAQGVHELNEAGLIPPVIEHVWDTNSILNENSTAGEIFKALFGYNGNPSLTEVAAYLSYFGLLLLGIRITSQTVVAFDTPD